ncbi:hypothetical protein LJK87_39385 [Paenibacillus sp. P25]|nr:hypothetical protein LJK87_39385 [Paenibacillus sp. P25]
MKRDHGLADTAFDVFVHILLVFLMIVTLYPLLYVAFASISDAGQLVSFKGILLRPLGFSLEAYKSVFANPGILIGYKNTLFIVVFGVIINLLLTSLGAYVLSRKNVMWNKVFIFVIVFTMFFSGGLVPSTSWLKGWA